MRLNHGNLSFAERAAVVFVFIFLSFSLAQAQSKPVNATIDASKTGAPISKYIYGQFLEHGGDIVNEGVWAEMLQTASSTTRLPRSRPKNLRFPRGDAAVRGDIGCRSAATNS